MPSTTFNKLNSTKKANFLNACVTEFGLKGYQGASISSIVKELEIAKGSVYQYFIDKEDLYSFLIGYSLETKEELISRAHLSSLNLREWIFAYLIVEIKFAQRFSNMSRLLMDSYGPLRNEIRKRELSIIKLGLNQFKNIRIQMDLQVSVEILYSIKNELIGSLQFRQIEEIVGKLESYIELFLNGMTNQSHEH